MADDVDPTDKGDLLGVMRRDIQSTSGGAAELANDLAASDLAGETAPPDDDDVAAMAARRDTDLAATIPLPVPSIAISLAGRSATEVGRLLRALPAQMDPIVGRYPVKLEVRLDLLPNFSERINALAVVLQLGVPVIATLRSKTEGGAIAQTDAERQRFLLTAMNALRNDAPRGSLLDIEADSIASDPDGWSQVVAAARERGFGLLLSHHELSVSPERAARLLPPEGLLDGAPGGGALIWKSASKARTWEQVLALLRAARRGNLQRRRAALMGLDDPVVRLVGPFLGMPLVYAAPDADHLAAPGQLPFRSLVHAWARWGVQHDDPAFGATLHGHEEEADADAEADDDRTHDRRTARVFAPRLALLGRPAWHSLSPAMHNDVARREALPHRYFPLEVPPHIGTGTEQDVIRHTLDTLRDIGVVGGNATIPFKRHLLEVADDVDDIAEAIGAANTFRFDGTRLQVTNTDGEGIRDVLDAAGVDLADADVLVLGAGGSARAAVHGLRDAASVRVSNRTGDRADELVKSLAKVVDADLSAVPWADRIEAASSANVIIQCTSMGLAGTDAADDDPLEGHDWTDKQVAVDLVYATPKLAELSLTKGDESGPTDDGSPFITPFLRGARAANATGIDGLEVLVAQGARAFEWWTGHAPDRTRMRAAAEAAANIPLDPLIRSTYERCEVIA